LKTYQINRSVRYVRARYFYDFKTNKSGYFFIRLNSWGDFFKNKLENFNYLGFFFLLKKQRLKKHLSKRTLKNFLARVFFFGRSYTNNYRGHLAQIAKHPYFLYELKGNLINMQENPYVQLYLQAKRMLLFKALYLGILYHREMALKTSKKVIPLDADIDPMQLFFMDGAKGRFNNLQEKNPTESEEDFSFAKKKKEKK